MSRSTSDSLDKRLVVPISEKLLEAVDDFRFSERVPNRAEAVRRLILEALEARGVKANDAPASVPAEPQAASQKKRPRKVI